VLFRSLQIALLTITAALPSARTAHVILNRVKISEPPFSKVNDDSREKLSHGTQERMTDAIGVRVDNVSFAYPDANRAALNDVSFEIEAGTQVALMGPSGAGKSTIADLLCSVLTPSAGSITRTGGTHGSSGTESHARVSYVPQRPGLVSGTILDNVALAEDVAKVDRVQALEALRLAHLADLVDQLPEGLDAPLGKLQDGLSGGQLQRLGLARALFTKPGLLIMDEATSALDAVSEAEIQKALDAMRGKVTVVLIAHRINTIQHADNVILVEEGQVKDSGTFKELIARNPSVERVVDLMAVQKD